MDEENAQVNPKEDLEALGNLQRSRFLADTLCESYTGKFEVPSISYAEIERISLLNDTKVVLIDVRSSDEQAISVVRGSISVEQFERIYRCNTSSLEEASTNIVFVPYCTIGYRSGVFATKLISSGWKSASGKIYTIYNGRGVVPWSYENLPLVKGFDDLTSTTELHVFGDRWNVAHPAYQAKTFTCCNKYKMYGLVGFIVIVIIMSFIILAHVVGESM